MPTSPTWKGEEDAGRGAVGGGHGEGVGVGEGGGSSTVLFGRAQATTRTITSTPTSVLRTILPSFPLRTNATRIVSPELRVSYPSNEIASRNFSKKPFETFSGLPVSPPTWRRRTFCSAVRSLGTTSCTSTYWSPRRPPRTSGLPLPASL